MRARIFLLGLALALTGCGDGQPSGPSFSIEMKAKGVTQDSVAKALDAFKKACAPLTTKHWGDVVEAKARVTDGYAPYRLEQGWLREIEISVQLVKDPKTIPVNMDEYGVPGGHTLWYYAGGGVNPGIFAKKRVSQALCGMRPDQDGRDTFKAVPELAAFQ